MMKIIMQSATGMVGTVVLAQTTTLTGTTIALRVCAWTPTLLQPLLLIVITFGDTQGVIES